MPPYAFLAQDFLDLPPIETSGLGENYAQEASGDILASAPPGIFGLASHPEQDPFPLLSLVTYFDSPSTSPHAPNSASTFGSTTPVAAPQEGTPEDISLHANTPAQSQSPQADHGAKLPLTRSRHHECPTCRKRFTAERLRYVWAISHLCTYFTSMQKLTDMHRAHLKPRRPGQPPAYSAVRYACPSERCRKHYADKPGLARHVDVCPYLLPVGASAPGYRCACGNSFHR